MLRGGYLVPSDEHLDLEVSMELFILRLGVLFICDNLLKLSQEKNGLAPLQRELVNGDKVMDVLELELSWLILLLLRFRIRLSSDLTWDSFLDGGHTNDSFFVLCDNLLDVLDRSIDRVGEDVGFVVADINIEELL